MKQIKKMNIIFLDIDGVLNRNNKIDGIFEYWCDFLGFKDLYEFVSKLFRVEETYSIHEKKVKYLSEIVKATDARIVLTSSFRKNVWDAYLNRTKEPPTDEIKLLLELFDKYNIKIYSITEKDRSHGIRQNEIIDWLARNESKVNNFVILDDEWKHLGLFYHDHLVLTCDADMTNENMRGKYYCHEGLRKRDIRKAIDIINNI